MHPSTTFSEAIQNWITVYMRRSTGDFNHFMKEMGISMPQFHTMIRIYYEGSTGVSAIAEDVGFTKAASSQMIDRLVRMGMVNRTENPDDRRERQIDLTQKGREAIQNFIKSSQKWMEKLGSGMSSEEQESIIKACTLISTASDNMNGKAS